MESIIDNERDEARAIEREPDFDRPTAAEAAAERVCPDIMGRDICYEPGNGDPF